MSRRWAPRLLVALMLAIVVSGVAVASPTRAATVASARAAIFTLAVVPVPLALGRYVLPARPAVGGGPQCYPRVPCHPNKPPTTPPVQGACYVNVPGWGCVFSANDVTNILKQFAQNFVTAIVDGIQQVVNKILAPFIGTLTATPDFSDAGAWPELNTFFSSMQTVALSLWLCLFLVALLRYWLTSIGAHNMPDALAGVRRGAGGMILLLLLPPAMNWWFKIVNEIAGQINTAGSGPLAQSLAGSMTNQVASGAIKIEQLILMIFLIVPFVIIAIIVAVVRIGGLFLLASFYAMGPLCVACWVSPDFKRIGTWWFENFAGYSFWGVGYAVAFKVLGVMLQGLPTTKSLGSGWPIAQAALLQPLMAIAGMLILLQVPRIVGSAMGGAVHGDAGGGIQSMLSQYALNSLSQLGRRGGANAEGKGGAKDGDGDSEAEEGNEGDGENGSDKQKTGMTPEKAPPLSATDAATGSGSIEMEEDAPNEPDGEGNEGNEASPPVPAPVSNADATSNGAAVEESSVPFEDDDDIDFEGAADAAAESEAVRQAAAVAAMAEAFSRNNDQLADAVAALSGAGPGGQGAGSRARSGGGPRGNGGGPGRGGPDNGEGGAAGANPGDDNALNPSGDPAWVTGRVVEGNAVVLPTEAEGVVEATPGGSSTNESSDDGQQTAEGLAAESDGEQGAGEQAATGTAAESGQDANRESGQDAKRAARGKTSGAGSKTGSNRRSPRAVAPYNPVNIAGLLGSPSSASASSVESEEDEKKEDESSISDLGEQTPGQDHIGVHVATPGTVGGASAPRDPRSNVEGASGPGRDDAVDAVEGQDQTTPSAASTGVNVSSAFPTVPQGRKEAPRGNNASMPNTANSVERAAVSAQGIEAVPTPPTSIDGLGAAMPPNSGTFESTPAVYVPTESSTPTQSLPSVAAAMSSQSPEYGSSPEYGPSPEHGAGQSTGQGGTGTPPPYAPSTAGASSTPTFAPEASSTIGVSGIEAYHAPSTAESHSTPAGRVHENNPGSSATGYAPYESYPTPPGTAPAPEGYRADVPNVGQTAPITGYGSSGGSGAPASEAPLQVDVGSAPLEPGGSGGGAFNSNRSGTTSLPGNGGPDRRGDDGASGRGTVGGRTGSGPRTTDEAKQVRARQNAKRHSAPTGNEKDE